MLQMIAVCIRNYFFIDGPGGSGKTNLYTALIHHFRGKNELCLVIVPHAMKPGIVQKSIRYADDWRKFQKLDLKAK